MKVQLFVGTYTGGKESDSVVTGSQGIYSFAMDADTGVLTYKGVYGNNEIDPGFFAIRDHILFSENERKDMGTVRSFAIGKDGSLTFIDKIETKGSKCAHVSVDRFGPYIFATNYAAGSVMVMKSDAQGHLVLTDHVQHYGKSVVPVRQDAPRAHSTRQTPDGKGILVPDLGIDRIMNYRLDRKTGKIHPYEYQSSIDVTPGEGPRHCVFHPNGKYLYLVTEIGNHIFCYSFDEDTSVLREFQKISVLPANFKGNSHSAEIIVTRDGRFVYSSNRGHDTIAGFSVNSKNGVLTSNGFFKSGGKGPRHICLSPDERFLIVANKDSDNVTVLEKNKQSGLLGKVLYEARVPAASCVAWTDLPV